jgi:hypothetical protein
VAELVFEWLGADLKMPSDAVAKLFAGWEIHYHEEAGERAAAGLLKGTEVHFIVAPEWRRRLIRRDNAKAFLSALLRDCGGMLTTRILLDSAGPAAFVDRIGFKKTWSDGTFNYFALCAPPFQRRAS